MNVPRCNAIGLFSGGPRFEFRTELILWSYFLMVLNSNHGLGLRCSLLLLLCIYDIFWGYPLRILDRECLRAYSLKIQSQAYITTGALPPVYHHIFITLRHLRVCRCGALFLTMERLCHLQLLLVLASPAILGASPAGLVIMFYCLRFETPPNLEDQVAVFISHRKRVDQLYPQALGSTFVASYESQGYGGGTRTRLHAESVLPPPNSVKVKVTLRLGKSW
jgi:hypothetical protein